MDCFGSTVSMPRDSTFKNRSRSTSSTECDVKTFIIEVGVEFLLYPVGPESRYPSFDCCGTISSDDPILDGAPVVVSSD